MTMRHPIGSFVPPSPFPLPGGGFGFAASNGLNSNIAIGNHGHIRFTTATALFKIGGIEAKRDGHWITLYNTLTVPWILLDEDASSTAANRLSCGGVNVALEPLSSASLQYDLTLARWRLMSTT